MKPYFQQGGVTMYHGDCLEIMPELKPPFDAIIADLPYGTTACKWDEIIPFEPLWLNYKRLIKRRGAVVLFGSQPFTSKLVMSNLEWFKYEWVWHKHKPTNIFQAYIHPLKIHEGICVFSELQSTYNPQKRDGTTYKQRGSHNIKVSGVSKEQPIGYSEKHEPNKRLPTSVLFFSNHNEKGNRLHPTQKPVNLMRYLIRTYTNRGDLILDNTAGSFSTGVACILEGRRFVGIEKELEYCEAGRERIIKALFESGENPESSEAKRPGYQMGFNLE